MNEDAKQVHKDMVLRLLLHHMSQETRQILMLELPAAYNDICGSDHVRVHRVSDGEPIIPGVMKTTRFLIGGDDGFPWCDSCKSYHHADNPTCVAKEA